MIIDVLNYRYKWYNQYLILITILTFQNDVYNVVEYKGRATRDGWAATVVPLNELFAFLNATAWYAFTRVLRESDECGGTARSE